jgi:hypothetical protein
MWRYCPPGKITDDPDLGETCPLGWGVCQLGFRALIRNREIGSTTALTTERLVMPQFGSSPIEATATVAVTFWYAWLFNHASGSSLLTLIAHATEGTIETSTLWQSAADTTRLTWLYCLVWCLVALGLLVFDRRLWTKPPGPVDDLDRVDARAESKM